MTAHDKLAAIPVEWAQPPAEMIGHLPKGGAQLDYVGHATVTKILLDIDPEWTLEPVLDERGLPVIDINPNGEAVMWGRLTVLGHTRLGVGTCPGKAFDREKQLVSDLLRNCAMRFGIATALWSKEEWSQPPPPPPVQMADSAAVDMLTAGLAALTPEQLERYGEWRKANNIPSLKRPITLDQADAIAGWLDDLAIGHTPLPVEDAKAQARAAVAKAKP